MLANYLLDFVDEIIVLTVVFFILLFVKRSRAAAMERRRQEKFNYEIRKRQGLHKTSP